MALLLVLNGVPGSGKSTLARRWVADRPLALALDVDVVRGLLGDWAAHPAEAGRAARELALVMARTHLSRGHDVVVPQLLARPEFLEQLEALAAEVGASFVEVVLDVDPSTMLTRFRERSAAGERGEHRDAAALVGAAGGERELLAVHERLEALVAQRPLALRLASTDGDVEGTHRALLTLLDGAGHMPNPVTSTVVVATTEPAPS